MSRQAEGRIQDAVIKRLKDEFPGIYIRKMSDRYTRGMFDLLVVDGRNTHGIRGSVYIHMEVKRPGEDLSELQKIEAVELESVCANWCVVTSPDQALDFVRCGKLHHRSVKAICPAGWRLQWDDETLDERKKKGKP